MGVGLLILGVNFADRVLDATPFAPFTELTGTLEVIQHRGRSYFAFETSEGPIKCDTIRCYGIGLEAAHGQAFTLTVDRRKTIFAVRSQGRELLSAADSDRTKFRDGAIAVSLIALSLVIMGGTLRARWRERRDRKKSQLIRHG